MTNRDISPWHFRRERDKGKGRERERQSEAEGKDEPIHVSIDR